MFVVSCHQFAPSLALASSLRYGETPWLAVVGVSARRERCDSAGERWEVDSKVAIWQ